MGNHTINPKKVKDRNQFCNQQNYTVRAQTFDARPKRQRTRQQELKAAICEYSYKD